MPLPDLYIVGAPKAGTTTIARWLSEHPAVYWSVPKEPYYWATDYPRMRAHYGFDSRAAYERLYASEQAFRARHRGDGSTTYLYSETAVPAIRESVPDARFVVCLRNPVDLVISYHKAARWPALRRLTHRPPPALEPGVRRLRQWSRTTRTPGVATVKRRMWRPEPRPAVGARERRELAEYFKADVELLSEIIRRDLASWAA